MTADFEKLLVVSRSPMECATLAASEGLSRLPVFKAIYDRWGDGPFTLGELEVLNEGYPNSNAWAAATIGLAALVLCYKDATLEDFVEFERTTGIGRKVEALARTDRSGDALGFYDRLDPDSLTLRPVAEATARQAIAEAVGEPRNTLSVQDERTITRSWGWLYFYESADYVETGDRSKMIEGAVPIIFDRYTAAMIETGTDKQPQEYLDQYEHSGWPVKF